MNKLTKLFVTFVSAITLLLSSVSSSFAKVDGDMICIRFSDIFNRKIFF